jgi:hypothetical protein
MTMPLKTLYDFIYWAALDWAAYQITVTFTFTKYG